MPQPPSAAAIKAELDRILGSQAFNNAYRSRRFLRYLVEHTLVEPDQHIKEYSIALDVFDRDPSYDPSVDATVRVEAGRLRSRLRDYYADTGREDDVIFEIPKGSYSVAFASRAVQITPGPVRAAPNHPLLPHPAPRALDYSIRLRWMLLLAFLFGGLLGFLAAHNNDLGRAAGKPCQVASQSISLITKGKVAAHEFHAARYT